MLFIEKIREISARRAQGRKMQLEMASITDDELRDLNLSYAQILEMSRR